MNLKLKSLTAGILVAVSAAASAQVAAPSAPAAYNNGPYAPIFTDVASSVYESEKVGYALLEGVLQVAEATIHSNGCNPGYYNLEVYANGATYSPSYNFATVTLGEAPQFSVYANVQSAFPGRGQLVTVSGNGGWFNSTQLVNFQATYAYNSADNILVTTSETANLVGINGTVDTYTGNVIKDFYLDTLWETSPNVYDWGLQSVSKLGYPVEKWWQRSESHHSDGVSGRTVFVKDRLVGETACRIIVDIQGDNDSGLYWEGANSQSGLPGVLTITTDVPGNLVTYTPSNPLYQGITNDYGSLIGPSGSVWDGCSFNNQQCDD